MPAGQPARRRRYFFFFGAGFLGAAFFGCRFLCRTFRRLRLDFGCVFYLDRLDLLWFCFFLREVGSGEFLAAVGDLGDADRGISLAMSAQFLVLLFAFVMEDQNFCASSLLHHFTGHQCAGFRARDLAGLAGDGQHVVELDLPVGAVALVLQPNHIAGRHPVLFTTGADDRVHTYASVQSCARRGLARLPGTC